MSSLNLEKRRLPVVVRRCFERVFWRTCTRYRCRDGSVREALTHVNSCARCGTASRDSCDKRLLVNNFREQQLQLLRALQRRPCQRRTSPCRLLRLQRAQHLQVDSTHETGCLEGLRRALLQLLSSSGGTFSVVCAKVRIGSVC